MHGDSEVRTAEDPGIVVVGAGLVGPVVAIYLARRYGAVTVLEKRRDPRRHGTRRRRSLTVILSARGWRVLTDLGVAEAVRAICLPLRGRCAHLPHGRSHVTQYSRDGQPIWSMEREGLHQLLLDAAEATPGVRIRFGQHVRAVDLDEPALLIDGPEGRRRLTCRRILGCDGAHSAARAALVARGAREHVQNLQLAYQEINLPSGLLDRRTMHYWPTGDALFGAFPTSSGPFAGFLFLRLDGPAPSYAAAAGGHGLLAQFTATFAELAAAIPDLAEQLVTKPICTVPLVRCDRWVWRDQLALLGDSCHAMAPFMGHGMNCAFEDARTLITCLDATNDWAAALAAYERDRMENADAISDISYQHYRTMAHPPDEEAAAATTVLRKRLIDLFPNQFVPLYERCAFAEESYAAARRHDQLLDGLVVTLLRRHGTGLVTASDSQLHEYVRWWLREDETSLLLGLKRSARHRLTWGEGSKAGPAHRARP